MKPGQCLSKCYRDDFPIKPLIKEAYTYWSGPGNRYRTNKPLLDKDGRPQRVKRYITAYKRAGLAKCKVCVYVTAKPTTPGTKCPCCKHQLSQSIRDIKVKWQEQQQQENP